MASDAETFRIKRESEASILNQDVNRYAVGIGPKFAGGAPTGELAICVFVHVKLPDPPQPIPPLIQGVPTDVIPLAAPVPHRVLTGGIEIRVQHTDAVQIGTLGCVARTSGVPDNQPPDVLLTCHHVLYEQGQLTGGNDVGVPSCSGCCTPTVAKVLRGDKAADAAIAALEPVVTAFWGRIIW